ncbi:MAG: Asp-tRNA(Asn)/Glu-tRNA(Gln) amidotransferase subunit GatA [Oscillospiraceae bacterium]|nr:Asp-tRNA(Asn)/Glu-tRNA(Gln) amidotransferase subunit GatA [Oscillospiraceae bacterium]
MDILNMTATELGMAIKNGEVTVREALDAYFEKIEKYDGTYHCYNTLCKKEAYRRADEVQKGIDEKTLTSPLAGVPIGIKDNICTKGVKTTCSSKILCNFVPPYNATVIARLEAAGMIVLGKLNMDEFAMGSTTETSATGVTHNPWDINKVPGGSSGGSAAAVSAGLAPVALGSDTGGSIRQPCSFCGVAGLKPTYGAVSRYGLVAYASSLDQIGPVGQTVEDCANMFSVISGKDEKDGTSMVYPEFSAEEALRGDVKGKKIGIPRDYLGDGISEDVKNAILQAAEVFKALGADVEMFDMPIVKYAIPAYYIIACAEACSNLSRYDGIKYGYKSDKALNLRDTYIMSRSEGFGMEVKRRIMLGNFVLSSGYYDAYYQKALKAKKLIQNAFFEAFKQYDMILGPVAPTTAPKIGESLSDPLKMYLGDIYTVMINIAGVPSMSAPCGFDSDGMPIGMQIIGKPFCEAEIMNAAQAFEKATEYHTKKPNLK